MPTAVPMGTVAGRASAQNEQPTSDRNPAGADVGTGLVRVTHSLRLRGPRGSAAAGADWVGRLPWKLSSLPSLVLSVLTGRSDSAGHPCPWGPPCPLSLHPGHLMGTEMDDRLRGAGKAEGPRNWQ